MVVSRQNKQLIALVVFASLVLGESLSAFAVNIKFTGKAVAGVTVLTEDEPTLVESTSFQNLANARTKITFPDGDSQFQLVQVDFSAESGCSGRGFPEAHCSVRILADGVEMSPSPILDTFDSVGQTDDLFEGHTIRRTIVLGPKGTHTIQVQAAVNISGAVFTLNNWSLTVTQYTLK